MRKNRHNYRYTKTYEMNKQTSPQKLAKVCADGDFCPVGGDPCPFNIHHCEDVLPEDWEKLEVKNEEENV